MPRAENIPCLRPVAQIRSVISLLSLTCLMTLVGRAQVPAAEPARGPAITSIQQYWDLSAQQKSQPQDFVLECTVTFFDPQWRILFVQDAAGNGAYVPYGNNAHAFKAGEAITARGTLVPPNADISFEHATIMPRVAKEPVPILPVSDHIAEHAKFLSKYVTLEGYVDRVRRPNDEHLHLIVALNGTLVYCWVLVDPSDRTGNWPRWRSWCLP
jgi:hypothetical protein